MSVNGNEAADADADAGEQKDIVGMALQLRILPLVADGRVSVGIPATVGMRMEVRSADCEDVAGRTW